LIQLTFRQKVKALLQAADQLDYPTSGSNKKAGEVVKNPFLCKSTGLADRVALFVLAGGQLIRSGDRFQAMSCILALLLRLRQACVHMALTMNVSCLSRRITKIQHEYGKFKAIDMSAFKDEHGINDDDAAIDELDKTLAQLSLNQSSLEGEMEEKENVEAIFEDNYLSTKVQGNSIIISTFYYCISTISITDLSSVIALT